MGQKGILWCSLVPKRSKIGQDSRNGWVMVKRLGDSIESHMGQKGILWCSFAPKSSKMGQEMAELWPFSPWKVAWFHWEAHGTKQDPLVFICSKKIQNRPRNGWVIGISSLRGCVIPLGSRWDKRGSFGAHLYQKDLKSVKKWLSYGQEVAWFHWEPHGTKGDPLLVSPKVMSVHC